MEEGSFLWEIATMFVECVNEVYNVDYTESDLQSIHIEQTSHIINFKDGKTYSLVGGLMTNPNWDELEKEVQYEQG